jgi:hypothetical protein
LGIWEKNVAIEPAAFELWRDPENSKNNSNEIRVKVRCTKEQLENAPSFEYYDASKSAAFNPRSASGRAATTGADSSRDR